MKTIPAKTFLTIRRNAQSLFSEGYKVEAWIYGVMRVFNPSKGCSHLVDMREETCDCEGFHFHGVCRHSAGLPELIKAQYRSYADRIDAILRDSKDASAVEWWEASEMVKRLIDAQWELIATYDAFFGGGTCEVPAVFVGYIEEPDAAELRAA